MTDFSKVMSKLPNSYTPKLLTSKIHGQLHVSCCEAENQIRGYAASPRVRQLAGGTQLHLLILQIRGYELERYGNVEF